tara:strand:+ start:905 stop:1156 length:252 start_codon:yes stop_codon:yes gene_type:complete
MKIHKETIASELELLINGVNSKKQTVEEIAAYIRWRDKQLTLTDVVVPKGTLFCGECGNKRELIVETDINSDRVCKSRLCKAK